MFEIAWSEIFIVAVVAIIFVGPKELPGMLRTFGRLLGQLRRTASEFQRTFSDALREAERQANVDKMREDLNAVRDIDPTKDLRKNLDEVKRAMSGRVDAPTPRPDAMPMGGPAAPSTTSGPAASSTASGPAASSTASGSAAPASAPVAPAASESPVVGGASPTPGTGPSSPAPAPAPTPAPAPVAPVPVATPAAPVPVMPVAEAAPPAEQAAELARAAGERR